MEALETDAEFIPMEEIVNGGEGGGEKEEEEEERKSELNGEEQKDVEDDDIDDGINVEYCDFNEKFHPRTAVQIIGSSSSRKTTICVSILNNLKDVLSFVPNRVLYVTPFIQNCMKPFVGKIDFIHDWNDSNLSHSSLKTKYKRSLVIVDDMAYNHQDKNFLVWCFQHLIKHAGICWIMLCHNLFSKSLPFSREISLNSDIFVLTSSPRTRSTVDIFSRQVSMGNEGKRFRECYNEVVNSVSPFQHFIYDARVATPERFRLRQNLTSDFGPLYVFTPKVKL